MDPLGRDPVPPRLGEPDMCLICCTKPEVSRGICILGPLDDLDKFRIGD